jgi:hypothetical protein
MDARVCDIFPGGTIAQLTEVNAVEDKRFKDVKLSQDIKLIGLNKIHVRTAEMMEDLVGQKVVVKINGTKADERIVRIKSKAEIAKEEKDRENAEKNGQQLKPISLEGKLIGTVADGTRAALAANKLQMDRIRLATDMLAIMESALCDRITSLEVQLAKLEAEEQGGDIIIIAKNTNNNANQPKQS